MTVPTLFMNLRYTGSGTTGPFSVPYQFSMASFLRVRQISAAGVITTLVLDVDYTVAGAGLEAGGTVTLTVALPVGEILEIDLGNALLTQGTDYVNGGKVNFETLEDSFDARALADQWLQQQVNRCLRFTDGSITDLPLVNDLKGRYLKFNSLTGAPEAGVFETGTAGRDDYTFSGDGSTVAFTLSSAVIAASIIDVYVSGIHQEPSSYSALDSTLTFTEAPPDGTDNIFVTVSETLPVGYTIADQVDYTQLGSGAVMRTVQDRLQEKVSIEDFGASESAADNAAAIQLALNSHGVIEIPDGRRYLVGSALTRTGGLHLLGSGSLVWTSGASTTGLTVSLTTANNYSDRVIIGPVQFRTLKTGVGTALTIDGSAQISGGVVQKGTFDRVKLDGTVFRGDNAPGVNGWLEHIVLDGIRNIDLRRLQISGYQGASEASIVSTYGVRVTAQGTPVHMNITNSNMFYMDKAIAIDTFEGLYVNTTNLVAINTGIYATASPTVKPQITAIGNHINARYRGIDVTSMQQVNVTNNNFYQRRSSLSTGTAVVLTDCEDFIISDNNMSADYGNTSGVTWYGVLLSGTTRDGSVHGNLWSDTTIGAWAQVDTDNIFLGSNRLVKENASATVTLYTNTSTGRIVIDAEKFSGKNGSAITSASGTLVDVNMGTLYPGQKFLVSANVTYTKGGTDGDTHTVILDGGGTATVVFTHDDNELRYRDVQAAAAVGVHTVTGFMTVTVGGTLTLRCQFTSIGSNSTIAAGAAQLAAVQLGNSMRLG